MMTYDRNGLQLSPKGETHNAYRMTYVDFTRKKFAAYARGNETESHISIKRIGYFDDPRTAAFVAQEFEKKYDKVQVDYLIDSGTFVQTVVEFTGSIDIPEWQYPAEGMTKDDLDSEFVYKFNRVDNAREALVEAIQLTGVTVPPVKKAKLMIKEVENLYKLGISYRDAAMKTVKGV